MTPNQPLPEPRAERHLRMLAELADMAMALTRAANAKATAQIVETGEATPDTIQDFTRLAQTVRQTIALEDTLARNPTPHHAPTNPAPRHLPRPAPQHSPSASAPRAAANARPAPPDTRHHDERLDADEAPYAPDTDRPLEDILADLAKDLGLPPTITETTPFPSTPPTPRQSKPTPLRTPRKWIARLPTHPKTPITPHTQPGQPPPPPD